MKTIKLSMFRQERTQIKSAMHYLREGCFIVLAHATRHYWVMDEDFNCKVILKPWVVMKFKSLGVFEERDNRLYLSSSAPAFEFD